MRNRSKDIHGNLHVRTLKLLILATVFFGPSYLFAQEVDEKPVDKPVRSLFESTILMDNQTALVPYKGTFEFDVIHRFGTFDKGYDDFYGLYSTSNVRLSMAYTPINKLSLGIGITKFKHLVDLNAKYAILRQTRSDRIPVAITYFGNMAFDTRSEDLRGEVFNSSDRVSYFHQVIIARKFSDRLSAQIAPSISHFNIIDSEMNNDQISLSFASQVKITDVTSILISVDQPLSGHDMNEPEANLCLGVQFVSSSHAFQLFFGNSNLILPQEINMFNRNSFSDNISENFLFGFNMTRLWSF